MPHCPPGSLHLATHLLLTWTLPRLLAMGPARRASAQDKRRRAEKMLLRSVPVPGAGHQGAQARPRAPGGSPVVPQREVGVAHRVVHAAAHQLSGLIHGHPGHLVCVALPGEGVVLPSLGIPVMWGPVKEKSPSPGWRGTPRPEGPKANPSSWAACEGQDRVHWPWGELLVHTGV